MVNRLISAAVFIAAAGVLSADAWIFTKDKILYETLDDNTVTVKGCDNTLVDAVIPSTVDYDGNTYEVVSIKASAFSSNSTLETLTAAESVATVGENAFFFAKKLREVNLPGVSSLGVGAFYLSTVEKVVFGKALTELPKDAFSSCKSKLEVDLSNIRVIGATAFRKCNMDKVVIYDGTTLSTGSFQESNIGAMTLNGEITLPETSNVFDKAKVETLTLVDLNIVGSRSAVNPTVNRLEIRQENNSAMNIGLIPSKTSAKVIVVDADIPAPTGNSTSPFSNTGLLEEVTFGPKAKLIFKSMFYNCTKLKTVNMSSSIEEVGNSAFANCDNITFVACDAAEPPVCSPDAFSATVYSNAKLQVPETGKDAYAAAEGWRLFGTIEGVSGIGEVAVAQDDIVRVADGRIVFGCSAGTEVAVYTVDGRLVYAGVACDVEPGHGFFVVRVGANVFKVRL